jgi:ribonuclease Z
MGLLGRQSDLHLYAPAPLKEIIDLQLKVADTVFPFTLFFHPLEEGLLVKTDKFEITCFNVYHRIDCWGFIFHEIRPPRKIDVDKIRLFDIPVSFYDELKWGKNYVRSNGEIILNETVTEAAPKGKSYAYTGDTMFNECVAARVKGVDMLYHETTYLKDLQDRAVKRFHSTTEDAATIAKKAGVHRLLIGHFSSKYDVLDEFQKEARDIFSNTDLALEGVTYRL